MEKDFFDVFPSLKVKKELEELLDMVFVTRVSCNPSRTHIWVYIKSERWIHKKHIFELEEQIERNSAFPVSTILRTFWKLTDPAWNWNCAATICWNTICSDRRRFLFPEKMIFI